MSIEKALHDFITDKKYEHTKAVFKLIENALTEKELEKLKENYEIEFILYEYYKKTNKEPTEIEFLELKKQCLQK
jgi:hypothetical protein